MDCGIHGNALIVRIDPEATGRPMKGWLLVGAAGLKDKAALGKWVRRGLDYAASLPKKQSH